MAAAVLPVPEAKAMLLAIGFDNAKRDLVTAVTGFQKGWNLGPALKVDGKCGRHTSAALRLSFARHSKGQSTMSANFSYVEFRCKGAADAACPRIWVVRTHVRRLEAYRAFVEAPVRIVSGCRCTRHNKAVGGALASQHMFGVASDVQALVTVERRREQRVFAGLGFRQSSRLVVHVDSRDVSGHNPGGGSPESPTEWRYAT